MTLTPEERQAWQALLAKGKANARKLAPARLLLPVDEAEAQAGRTDEETAAALHLSVRTSERVGERLVEQGFTAALLPAPSQRGYARSFDGASAAWLLALAGGVPPEGQARGTLRLLAEQLVERQVLDSVSRQGVPQALKKTNSRRTGRRCGASHPSRRRSLSATGKRSCRCIIGHRIRSARWCAGTKPSGHWWVKRASRCQSSRAQWKAMTASLCGMGGRACSSPLSRSRAGGR